MTVKEKLKNNFQEFLDNFLKALKRPEMAVLPGQLAFFYVLSLVPTLTLITYTASVLNVSTDMFYNFLAKAFSGDVANLLLSTSSSASGFGFFIAICIGYYIASNGASSVIITSNTIYGIKDKGFIHRRVKALLMTFVLSIFFLSFHSFLYFGLPIWIVWRKKIIHINPVRLSQPSVLPLNKIIFLQFLQKLIDLFVPTVHKSHHLFDGKIDKHAPVIISPITSIDLRETSAIKQNHV